MLPDFDALWDFNKPAETESAFRQVLADTAATADAAYAAELKTQLARTFGLRRQFDEAHAVLDEVEASGVAASGRPRVRYLLERGRAFNSSKQPEKALPLFVEAWEIGKTGVSDRLAIDAAHMAGIVEKGDASHQWNLMALELATSSAEPAARRWRKSLHNNIGWTYFAMGDLDMAMHHFVLCREAAEENEDIPSEQIARWCIAKTHRVQGRPEVALEMQLVRLAEVEAAGEAGGFVHEEVAECLYALSRPEDAAPHFAKAFEELSKDPWISEDEPQRLERLKELGGLKER